MKKFTKQERQEYTQGLRDRWKAMKEYSEQHKESLEPMWLAAQETLSGKFSFVAFCDILAQMQSLGMEGSPYIDCKTFNGWSLSGFKVKKGEKSKISGITFMSGKSKEKEGENNEDAKDTSFAFPKTYYLFHKSQVEEIKN